MISVFSVAYENEAQSDWTGSEGRGAVASHVANLSSRAIGQHYGIGSSAIGAIHRRLVDRPESAEDRRIGDNATKAEENKVHSVSLTPSAA